MCEHNVIDRVFRWTIRMACVVCVCVCTCSRGGRAPEAPGFFMCRQHAAEMSTELRCAISLSTDVIAGITQLDMAGRL